MFLRLFLQLFVFSSLLLSYSQDALSTIKKMNPKKNKVSFKTNRFPNLAKHTPYQRLFLIQICKFSLVPFPFRILIDIWGLSSDPRTDYNSSGKRTSLTHLDPWAYPCMLICNVKLQSCRNIFWLLFRNGCYIYKCKKITSLPKRYYVELIYGISYTDDKILS